MTAALLVIALAVGFWAGVGWSAWLARVTTDNHVTEALRLVQPDIPPEDRPDWPAAA